MEVKQKLDRRIDDILEALKNEDCENREEMTKELESLYTLRIEEKKADNDKFSAICSTCVDIAKGLIGITATFITVSEVLRYEKEDIIGTKALAFIPKIKLF